MNNEDKTEDTVENLRIQIKKLNRIISLQEKRITRAENVMSTRSKVTDLLKAERVRQDDIIRQVKAAEKILLPFSLFPFPFSLLPNSRGFLTPVSARVPV